MFSKEIIEEVTDGVKEFLNKYSIPFVDNEPDASYHYAKVYVNKETVSFGSNPDDIGKYEPKNVIIVSFPDDMSTADFRKEVTAYFEKKAQEYGCKVRTTGGLICLCKEA